MSPHQQQALHQLFLWRSVPEDQNQYGAMSSGMISDAVSSHSSLLQLIQTHAAAERRRFAWLGEDIVLTGNDVPSYFRSPLNAFEIGGKGILLVRLCNNRSTDPRLVINIF